MNNNIIQNEIELMVTEFGTNIRPYLNSIVSLALSEGKKLGKEEVGIEIKKILDETNLIEEPKSAYGKLSTLLTSFANEEINKLKK